YELDGQILCTQQTRPRRVVDIVVDVRDEIGNAHDLPFDGARAHRGWHADGRARFSLRVLGNAVTDVQGGVQAAALVLQLIDDAQALLVVVEAAGHERIDDAFARVAKRRVPEI